MGVVLLVLLSGPLLIACCFVFVLIAMMFAACLSECSECSALAALIAGVMFCCNALCCELPCGCAGALRFVALALAHRVLHEWPRQVWSSMVLLSSSVLMPILRALPKLCWEVLV